MFVEAVRELLARRRRARQHYPASVNIAGLEEDAALIALLRERPRRVSWIQASDALIEHGSAEAVWAELDSSGLFNVRPAAAMAQARSDLRSWQSQGLTFLSILDPRYPARVRDIHEAPPFLFARGELRDEDIGVSVVGSRAASSRGLAMTTSIAEALIGIEVTVISGLATGIDATAHEATLASGGRTVAIIGTGINNSYPATNTDLQQRIARQGLLLSQFWPDAPPTKQSFPMRNAVMSGYGIATIVVEAGEHSGARIQARMAVNHGRPVILTDLVVARTDWGRALLDRPDVYQASSTDEIVRIVDGLRAWPREVRTALDEISV